MCPGTLQEASGLEPRGWRVGGVEAQPVGSPWAAPRSRQCRGDTACVLFVSKLSAIREHSSDNGNYLVEKRDPTPWEREV